MKEIISLQSVIWNKQIISLNQRKILLIHITHHAIAQKKPLAIFL